MDTKKPFLTDFSSGTDHSVDVYFHVDGMINIAGDNGLTLKLSPKDAAMLAVELKYAVLEAQSVTSGYLTHLIGEHDV